jgi:UDP-glucose 4-epimerase
MQDSWIKTIADTRFFVVGGAGFIGAHFVDFLLGDEGRAKRVTVYDNFSSGREWHLAAHTKDPRLTVVRGQVEDLPALRQAMDGHDVVIHLASNPDIARAATEPDIDFWQGTALTHSVVEAMRTTSAKRILYASGSGVYGEYGTQSLGEDQGPLLPISTYGASKLAGEALIASYTFMFGLSGCAFRFGNVVGPRQTHGVGFDFARRLLKDPTRLQILGDGTQRKPYVHISDIVSAVLTAHVRTPERYQVYNVAPGDTITVTEIAELALECLGLSRQAVRFEYTGGDRGWRGDVPVVVLDTARIRGLGWSPRHDSRSALEKAIEAMLPDLKAGRM